ncbi:alpha/beta fold hydrolase [Streptomyces sp. NPDC050516]|uniref:alpha/beta fold hydrolase n=1 Tax=Streptomyces sp. NPDC050516 TaxID=3365621 RepID=UPI0037933187
MPYASVNGQQLYFEDTGGDGPVVVFSHGNLMNRRMWEPQVRALGGEFRCVVWDARLHGRTKDGGGLYTYWDSADDLLGLLDHLGVEQAALVGHSQGGFLSLRAALRAPERVSSLVLIDTAAVVWPGEALAQMGGVSEGFRAGGPDAVAPVLLDLLLGRPDVNEEWLREWRAQPRERLADAVAVLMGVDDISARLGEIRQPALIVHGEADGPVPLPLGRMLQDRLPGAVGLAVIPAAGHTPSLTHPGEVNACLSAFLRHGVVSPPVDDPALLPAAFQDALNAHDAERVLALYAEGAVMRTVAGEVIRGSAALRAEVEGMIAADPCIANTVRHVVVGEGTALVVVDWKLSLAGAGGERVAASGTAANVAARAHDGTWRFTILNPGGCGVSPS